MNIDIETARQFVHGQRPSPRPPPVGHPGRRRPGRAAPDRPPRVPQPRRRVRPRARARRPLPRQSARRHAPGLGRADRGRRDRRPDGGRCGRVGRVGRPARRRRADRAALGGRLPTRTLDGAVRGQWLPHLRPRRQALADRDRQGVAGPGHRVVLEPGGGRRAGRRLRDEVRDRLPRRRPRPAPRRDGTGADAAGPRCGRLRRRTRRHRGRAAHPARLLPPSRAAQPRVCSPTTRSRPTSTGWRPASARTAAGRSSISSGPRRRRWSGAASPPSWPSACSGRTGGSAS